MHEQLADLRVAVGCLVATAVWLVCTAVVAGVLWLGWVVLRALFGGIN
jgi:hypothetical protein